MALCLLRCCIQRGVPVGHGDIASAANLAGVLGQRHGAQVDGGFDLVDPAGFVGYEGVAEQDVAGLLGEALELGRVEPGEVLAMPFDLVIDSARVRPW